MDRILCMDKTISRAQIPYTSIHSYWEIKRIINETNPTTNPWSEPMPFCEIHPASTMRESAHVDEMVNILSWHIKTLCENKNWHLAAKYIQILIALEPDYLIKSDIDKTFISMMETVAIEMMKVKGFSSGKLFGVLSRSATHESYRHQIYNRIAILYLCHALESKDISYFSGMMKTALEFFTHAHRANPEEGQYQQNKIKAVELGSVWTRENGFPINHIAPKRCEDIYDLEKSLDVDVTEPLLLARHLSPKSWAKE